MSKVSGPHPDGPKYGLGNGQQTILLAVVSELTKEEFQDCRDRETFDLPAPRHTHNHTIIHAPDQRSFTPFLQVYLDQPGWTVHEDLSTYNLDSFAHLIPQVKQSVMRIKEVLGVPLDAAGAIEAAGGVDESEMVGVQGRIYRVYDSEGPA